MMCICTFVLLFSSCSKDDDNKLSFDKGRIEVIIGKTEVVTVKNGNGTYTAVSSGNKIATTKADKNKISITGVAKGTVNVTVKNKGRIGTIIVSVIEDPNKEDPNKVIKEDSKTKFDWDKTKKIEGTDKGAYKLSQAKDGKVEWSWKSADGKNTISLTFTDKAGSITEGSKKDIKLLIDGKETKVTKLDVIQTKVSGKDKKPTIWIVFDADKKKGICVGTLS